MMQFTFGKSTKSTEEKLDMVNRYFVNLTSTAYFIRGQQELARRCYSPVSRSGRHTGGASWGNG